MRGLWWAFLRLFFRLLYHEFAWAYDAVAWVVSLGQWKAWGRTALDYVEGTRVLELGHGTGHLLAAMAQHGLDPVGLDLSPQMGRQANRRLQRVSLTVPLIRARVQTLPLRDASLDSVVATFPTAFIADPETLRETARVLRLKGRLVVVAWARLGGRDPLSHVIRWLYRVTGQEKPRAGRVAPLVAEAGLNPRLVWEQVGQSAVLLLIADKGE